MEITEEMRRVKAAAKHAFQDISGVQGVGLGGVSTLIVYVRDADIAQEIPSDFQGFMVTKIVTGQISPYP
jgi:hypothetical protein